MPYFNYKKLFLFRKFFLRIELSQWTKLDRPANRKSFFKEIRVYLYISRLVLERSLGRLNQQSFHPMKIFILCLINIHSRVYLRIRHFTLAQNLTQNIRIFFRKNIGHFLGYFFFFLIFVLRVKRCPRYLKNVWQYVNLGSLPKYNKL